MLPQRRSHTVAVVLRLPEPREEPTSHTDLSDSSTPTRARSTASSSFSPPSTLPSSASPGPGSTRRSLFGMPGNDDAEKRAAKAAKKIRTKSSLLSVGRGRPPLRRPASSITAHAPTARQQQGHLPSRSRSLTDIQAGLSPSERGQSAAAGSGGPSPGPAPAGLAGQVRSFGPSGQRTPAPVQEEDCLSVADQGTRTTAANAGSTRDSTTPDARDLAWEQARLRFAQFTMGAKAEEKAGVSAAQAHAQVHEPTLAALATLATIPPSPSSETQDGVSTPTSQTLRFRHNSHASLPDRATDRRDPCPKFSVDPSPLGWPGLEMSKKRRRISQIQRWAGEIAAYGENRTYCGCSIGCFVPASEWPIEEPEYTLHDDLDSLDDYAHLPQLVPNMERPTMPAPPPAARTAPSTSGDSFVPRSLPPPVPQTAFSGSGPSSPTSSKRRSGSTMSGTCCMACGHRLMPRRPFVDIDDAGIAKFDLPKVNPPSGFQKALRGFRDLLSRKSKIEYQPIAREIPPPELAELSPQHLHDLARLAPWDQWYELNSRHMSGDFFTHTLMYSGPTDGNNVARRSTLATLTHRHQSTSGYAGTAGDVPALPMLPIVHDDSSSQVTSLSDSDSAHADSHEQERQRRREMDARLLRAQRLMAQTDSKKVAAETEAAVEAAEAAAAAAAGRRASRVSRRFSTIGPIRV